jgi:hypothetical protein
VAAWSATINGTVSGTVVDNLGSGQTVTSAAPISVAPGLSAAQLIYTVTGKK